MREAQLLLLFRERLEIEKVTISDIYVAVTFMRFHVHPPWRATTPSALYNLGDNSMKALSRAYKDLKCALIESSVIL